VRPRPVIVDALADRLRDLLGERLIAVILGGSWSLGDFVEGESDLDLLVVVRDELSRDDLARLSTLHERLLIEEPEALLLEGDYAPRAWLVPTGTTRPVPFFRQGRLQPDSELMLSADNIANLRRDGIAVYGPRPAEVLPEVTADEVRAAVLEMVREEPVAPSERAAAQEILELVRSLCAIETGLPTTKSDGVRWALEHVSPRWHKVVLRADEIRRGAPTDDAEPTLRCALTDMRAELLRRA
jgi:hypothetical protein